MLIGLSGFISCGKDTVANFLVSNYGFQKVSFASCLKDVCSVIFGWDRSKLEGDTKESRTFRETVDPWWSQRLNIPNFTPRYAFQHIGTDTLRNYFHDEIWIAAFEKKIQSLLDQNVNIVCTDCRFLNEINCIKQLGGVVWLIERFEKPIWYNVALKASQQDLHSIEKCKVLQIHASEYSHLAGSFDQIIKNDSSIKNLEDKIKKIVDLYFVPF